MVLALYLISCLLWLELRLLRIAMNFHVMEPICGNPRRLHYFRIPVIPSMFNPQPRCRDYCSVARTKLSARVANKGKLHIRTNLVFRGEEKVLRARAEEHLANLNPVSIRR